jgi:peptide-methionine (S)-S-oxide reductase
MRSRLKYIVLIISVAVAGSVIGLSYCGCSEAQGQAAAGEREPEAAMERNNKGSTFGNSDSAYLSTFGGGCFWCLEAVFERIDGVKTVISGYAGGTKENPSYKEISSGATGHAEVVRIAYDPEVISYEGLLDVFWKAHNPTTLNRQGADEGTQYRSIILYHDASQKETAERSKAEISKSDKFQNGIVTEIKALETFYAAEEYHQDYFKKNPSAAYCAFIIQPKLQKLGLEDSKQQ